MTFLFTKIDQIKISSLISIFSAEKKIHVKMLVT